MLDRDDMAGRDAPVRAGGDDSGDRWGAWRAWISDVLDTTGVGVRAAVGGAAMVGLLVGSFWWLTRQVPVPVEAGLPLIDVASVSTTTSSPGPVVVHVSGAVATPGVQRLPPGSRVVDAVEAAGGLAADADVDRINLAAVVVDGGHVHVPRLGEPVPDAVDDGGSAGSGMVNLNTADASRLESLPGIGPATAAAIIDHRDRHGPFRSVEGLLAVRGIGEAKLATLRRHVRV